jgi:hypothetical protein
MPAAFIDLSRATFALVVALVPLYATAAILWLEQRRRERDTKFPFNRRTLRPSGESLRLLVDELDREFSDQLFYLLASCVVLGIGAWVAYERVSMGSFVGFLGLGAALFYSVRAFRLIRFRRRCYLGFLGERAVGEELATLLADGWCVFHDITFDENPGGDPLNVDHVVVGTGGVFAIETQTRRKKSLPHGGEVSFDGRAVHYPWGREENGVLQALDHCTRLTKMLSESLARPLMVKPVLALPGWTVRHREPGDLTVVGGRDICAIFEDERNKARLDAATVQSIRALLEQKCREAGGR